MPKGQNSYSVCITSYNRIDCARISQEIIAARYKACEAVVHATSTGADASYLESIYLPRAPRPLHEGAMDLLQAGCAAPTGAEFVVHLEADTWITDDRVIERYITLMQQERADLATSYWSPSSIFDGPKAWRWRAKLGGFRYIVGKGDFTTQFFILRRKSLLYDELQLLTPAPDERAERVLYKLATRTKSRVVLMTERSPVKPATRYVCPQLSLYAQHWPAIGTAKDPRLPSDPLFVPAATPGKREVLRSHKLETAGRHAARLCSATDLSYYNRGALRY